MDPSTEAPCARKAAHPFPDLESPAERQARLRAEAAEARAERLLLVVSTARAALRRLGEVAARGSRGEVRAAVRALAPSLGLDDNDTARAGLLPDDPAEGAGVPLPPDALLRARAALPALEAAAMGPSRAAVLQAIDALRAALGGGA